MWPKGGLTSVRDSHPLAKGLSKRGASVGPSHFHTSVGPPTPPHLFPMLRGPLIPSLGSGGRGVCEVSPHPMQKALMHACHEGLEE